MSSTDPIPSISAGPSDVLARISAIQSRIATIRSRFSMDSAAGVNTPAGGSGAPVTDTYGRDEKIGKITSAAYSQLGVPYVAGAATPGTGWDCSSFTQYCYAQAGISVPRVSYEQATQGTGVDYSDAKPGDLLAFHYDRDGRSGVNHVAIYLGGGKMIEAPHTGANVRVVDVDTKHLVAVRRIVPEAVPSGPVVAPPAQTPSTAGQEGRAESPGWRDRLPESGRVWADEIEAAARQNNVDPALVAAVCWQESSFHQSSRSSTGAIGLMQLMPGTAKGLKVDATDPRQNLEGGARYISIQLRRFGNVDDALAAYFGGPGAVAEYRDNPRYPGTRMYVSRVSDKYATLRGLDS